MGGERLGLSLGPGLGNGPIKIAVVWQRLSEVKNLSLKSESSGLTGVIANLSADLLICLHHPQSTEFY